MFEELELFGRSMYYTLIERDYDELIRRVGVRIGLRSCNTAAAANVSLASHCLHSHIQENVTPQVFTTEDASMSLTIFPESTHQFPGKSCLPRRTIRGEARLFVLDFVTAVSAAEEEGERGRGGDALQWKPWARDSRTPLATLRRRS